MNKFTGIVATRLGLSPEQVTGALTSRDIVEWDSMNFLLLITDLEKEFGVSFSMDEVLAINSIGQIQTLLIAKGVAL